MPKTKSLREQRQEKRIREILEVALTLFAEKGYQGASMEDIAGAALLTRTGLYRYYPDKASLLKALRKSKIHDLTQRTAAALEPGGSFEDKIRAVIKVMLVFQEDNPGFFRILFTAGTLSELHQETVFEMYATLLGGLMSDAIASGQIKSPASADDLLMMLVSLMFKSAIKRNVLGYEPLGTLEHDVRLMTEVFLYGVLDKG